MAKWEKSGKVPKTIDLTIRLLFNERHDGSKNMATLIETLNALDRTSNARIVIKEERSRWTAKIEVEPEPLAA